MLPLHSLPPQQQEAINLQVARIKTDFAIKGDLLTLDELAQVIGKKTNYLWNLRNRGQMPPIPATRIGGHDQYWVVHVVMWLMQTTQALPNEQQALAGVGLAKSGSVATAASPSAAKAGPILGKGGKHRAAAAERGKMDAAKKAIIEKGMKILEDRKAANTRRG